MNTAFLFCSLLAYNFLSPSSLSLLMFHPRRSTIITKVRIINNSFTTPPLPQAPMTDTAAYDLYTHVAMPQKYPYGVELEAGKDYYWCTCGLSKNQPFCDGSHRKYNEEHNTTLKPMKFTAKETGNAHLCGCKLTKTPPYCDGSHRTADA